MSRFVDGPAAGRELMLRRAPRFLRVVVAEDGVVDALDQVDDEPRDGETVYVYVQVPGTRTVAFVDYRGRDRHLSGRYEFADYEHRADVDGEQLRDTAPWRAWTAAQPDGVEVA